MRVPGMTACRRRARAALLLALTAALAPPAAAEETLVVGYLHLKKDARYTKKRTFARFLGHPLGRPYRGAAVALEESKFHGAAAGVGFDLESKRVRDGDALLATLSRLSRVWSFLSDQPR